MKRVLGGRYPFWRARSFRSASQPTTARVIGETLDSIIRQLTDEVEIVVVDGASTDATRTVMERYAADCPGLRYIRLPERGGGDQDFCKAVEYARGEYCWLFPDDDLFKPGAVQRVLTELRNSYSLVIVNAEVMDRGYAFSRRRNFSRQCHGRTKK